jgi:hypothetical protein
MSKWRRARHRLGRLLRGIFRLHPLVFAALSTSVTMACMSPMTPAAKLNEAVQETNMAMRFGRNDLAIERVSGIARAEFIKAHRLWGNELRIVDFEMGGLEKLTEKEAVVLVAFSWFRPGDGQLRATIVRQTWKNDDGSGPWFITKEDVASGDAGLLGEVKVKVLSPEKKDTHFETTVIPGK